MTWRNYVAFCCFLLQDVDKLRHAVGIKAYSSQQPLEEFRLEANRAFLVLLDSYRDAVVSRLMVPDLNFSLLLDQQEAWSGDADGGQQSSIGQPAASPTPAEVHVFSNGANSHLTGGNGFLPGKEDSDVLQPLGAKGRSQL